ncbi:acyltransferase-like protein At1g54570, chloroplastic [Coffea eugenioides]|uniref:acyltransferase-like protein At1g54570, chloroplastic n=1 Tax=Coffea eugenioides TaxID=49369 RepID=UPI000F61156D|nr:acyltransferase-like protein At1g54570, chloroplastic [Coffea eugenioides]
MASLMRNLWASSSFALTEFKPQSRAQIRCSAAQESSILSTDTVRLNGVSSAKKQEITNPMMDRGTGHLPAGASTREKKKKGEEEVMQEKLKPLWDDGYGTRSVKDYMDSAKDVIKPDGGPPRWFSPIECGPPLKNSPVLLFLPGMDGLGLGLMLHHNALGRVFEVWCLHIPVKDRTPFEDMVNFVEETVRNQHASSPNKPIYLVGDSFGGCLALAVAARNPVIDLVLVLANPATSFNRSQLQPLLPFLEAIPIELHFTVPYLLSFVMGEPVKMAMATVDATLPPRIALEHLAGNLTALLPRLSVLADIIPKDTLLWKLKLLRSAASYANSRLHAVTAEVLVLASGQDNMLPSGDEAQRLERSLGNCKVKYFKDNSHAILLEDGVNLLTIIKGAFKYRQSRKHDVVMDFLPPSDSEFKQTLESHKIYRYLIGSVMFSTLEDGKIVRGLSGVPSEGPVILVGYHMLLGLELVSLVEEFLRQRKILVRGIAHPMLFSQLVETDVKEFTFFDTFKIYGATPVSATNLFKLFKTKSHVLLYPGGAREALHRKGETYKLFWPDQPEFVRMAAKFGATIVPFGVIGEDDMAELVFDYNDLMKIPVLNDYIRKKNEDWNFRARAHATGEVANQELHLPGFLPKVPGRLYYLFGKPIQTKGRQELLKDREKARELYLQIKSEVENSMAYLLRKREEDPYRTILDRTAYRAFFAPIDQVPTFDP